MILIKNPCWIIIIVLFACHNKQEDYTMINNISEKKVDATLLELVPEKGLVFFENQLFTGTSTSFYDNDSLAESIDYLEGVKHGNHNKYFQNGLLSYKSSYKDGKQNGLTKSWWRNGNMRSELYIENGTGEGVQKQFYQSGKLFKKTNLKEGREYGLQQSWRENGKLYNNYEAKHGRIFGLKRASLCFSLENEEVVLQSQNE